MNINPPAVEPTTTTTAAAAAAAAAAAIACVLVVTSSDVLLCRSRKHTRHAHTPGSVLSVFPLGSYAQMK